MSILNFRKLFRSEILFRFGATKINMLPNLNLPQIAFVGKSNVGKSSLINALCNRKDLAKVSHTPGRTQQINFFDVSGHLFLVDLPGYGYAKVSDQTKAGWERLITHYLFTLKPNLINLLIDARRGINNNDLEVLDMIIGNDIAVQIVFTKSDEIKNQQSLVDNTCIFIKNRYNKTIDIILTSAKGKYGISELQNSFYKHVKSKS